MLWNGPTTALLSRGSGIRTQLDRYARSIRSNGLRGTVQNVASLLEDVLFDRTHKTETSRHVRLNNLGFRSGNKHLGNMYMPIRVRAFRKLMAHLGLPAGKVFVDFGCGKGRVLCAAAEHPFRRIVGIEFAPELCEVCKENVDVYRRNARSSARIEVIQSDIVEYEFRHDEDVLFLFNSFKPALMKSLLDNIGASLRARPRDIMLILANPDDLAPVIERDDLLAKRGDFRYGSSAFAIYVNRR